MGQDKSKLQPGDLIEIDRPFHQHWALYMGDGFVINLVPVGKQKAKLGAHEVPVFTRTVKKQRLKEVVRRTKWRINNKSDVSPAPLPVEKIISRAAACIGKEMKYCSFGRNCEHFVTQLRYGEAESEQDFVGVEMIIPGMRDDKDYPKPGDLIEIKRRHCDHWALYMGNGYVIYVAAVDEGVPSLSAGSETILIMKVKMELLGEVAGDDDWAVNNKYDQNCSPLPVEQIIQRAERCIGKEIVYEVFDFKSDDFVRKLRYGGRLKAFLGGEFHILDMRDGKDYPKPGDLIEIKRGHYDHWALYVGDGYVIHVTRVGEKSSPVSTGSVTLAPIKAKVMKELLEEVAGKDNWRVNNKYDHCRTPFPVEEIIHRAESQIGKVMRYHLFNKNCEHYVTELRYGEAVSDQAVAALPKVRAIAAPVISGVGGAAVGALARLPLLAGLALPTPVPIVAGVGFAILTNIVTISVNIADHFTHTKFVKANKDILEQSCC